MRYGRLLYQDEAPSLVFPVFFSSEHSQPRICEKTPFARGALPRMHQSTWISVWTSLVPDFLLEAGLSRRALSSERRTSDLILRGAGSS